MQSDCSSASAWSNHAACALGCRTRSEPAAGSPSKPSRYWPDSACQRLAPSLTITRSATAAMLKPESGIDSGRRRRSARSDAVMRRAGTLAIVSACAVRRAIRSWNEKRQALRGPRAGETKPAATSERMVLRGSCSSFSTSRTPYCCTYFLLFRGFLRRGFFGLRFPRRFLFQAGAQGFHEIDHLPALLRLLGGGDLLARDLLLHRRLDARAHLVGVLRGIELVRRLLLDQLLRQLELGRLDVGLGDVDVAQRANFACVQKLLHDQTLDQVLDRPDHDDV